MNAGLLRPASEVSVLLWMRGPHFNLKRDLRIEVRFASDDLSSVIFGQPTLYKREALVQRETRISVVLIPTSGSINSPRNVGVNPIIEEF